MFDSTIEGRPILQDADSQSSDPTLPAFLAPPSDAPAYYGFPLVPETETGGWIYGAITAFEDPQGCVAGDGYVQAPDGSRAGLVWGPDEEHMEEYLAPDEDRWGVYAIRFPRPIRTVQDLVDNFRAILPDLRRKYFEIGGGSSSEA
jgi:hypothetical protein